MNKYIEELMEHLNHTEIWLGTTEKYVDYDTGIGALTEKFLEHKKKKTRVFFIGNGGSSAIASHMTADFMKNGGMNTYSLYDSAVMTCMGNDYGYEFVFSKPLGFLVKPGDLVVAISSSGNSPNIISGIETARQQGAVIITFTGFWPEHKAKQRGEINVYVPCEKNGIVEYIDNLLFQQIVDEITVMDGDEIR